MQIFSDSFRGFYGLPVEYNDIMKQGKKIFFTGRDKNKKTPRFGAFSIM
jgi:hypothetical protein